MIKKEIFKAYDIRGVYPTELNEEAAYKIAQAFSKLYQPKTIALGRDVRLSGPSLWKSAAKGFTDHGVSVVDVGVITTDMVIFASAAYDYDAAITISASHNPKEYNGLKMFRRGALTVSGEDGIPQLQELVLSNYSYKAQTPGAITQRDISKDYLAKCLSFIDVDVIKPMRVVVNGMCGGVVKNVEALGLPIELLKLNAEPDGNFPKGSPDPLLPENRAETIAMVTSSHADMGAAWDGDADRFFLFDDLGRFIRPYFLTAFLGAYFSKKLPGSTIIHDPRLTWAIEEAVTASGGSTFVSKAGSSYFRHHLREQDAVFGGESSGHLFFRDFYYADNGLIPFLLILEIVSKSGKKVSELFEPYFKKYFVSDETNLPLSDAKDVRLALDRVSYKYADAKIDTLDGVSIEYSKWRANIRPSNTQPLLRINLEARSQQIQTEKLAELLATIQQ